MKMTNKYEIYSTLLIIGKMKAKTKIGYHSILTRYYYHKINDDTWEYGKMQPSNSVNENVNCTALTEEYMEVPIKHTKYKTQLL